MSLEVGSKILLRGTYGTQIEVRCVYCLVYCSTDVPLHALHHKTIHTNAIPCFGENWLGKLTQSKILWICEQ